MQKRTSNDMSWKVLASADGVVRFLFIGSIYLLALTTSFILSGIWGVLVLGVVAILTGGILALRSGYELYPGVRRSLGGVISGGILSVIVIILLTLADQGASFFFTSFVLAASMVTMAFIGRIVLARRINLKHIASVVVFAAALYLLALEVTFTPIWIWVGYALVLIPIIDFFVTKIFKTDVLLSWVGVFWNGVGALLVGMAGVLWFSTQGAISITELFNAPILVGISGISVAVLFTASIFTRIKMRMAEGYLVYKRLVSALIILTGGFLLSGSDMSGDTLLYSVAASILLLTALYIADKPTTN